jgi:hypothetical protein
VFKIHEGHKVHREIFTLNGIERGIHKDSEWDYIVQPIIARWVSDLTTKLHKFYIMTLLQVHL